MILRKIIVYILHRAIFEVLKDVYCSRTFEKQRFLLQQRKHKFDATFINSKVNKFHSVAGDNIVIAYVDGIFPLTMKGLDGGGSTHKRLIVLISKKYALF